MSRRLFPTLLLFLILAAFTGCKPPPPAPPKAASAPDTRTIPLDGTRIELTRGSKTLAEIRPAGGAPNLFLNGGRGEKIAVQEDPVSGDFKSITITRVLPDGSKLELEIDPLGKVIDRTRHPLGSLPGDPGYTPAPAAELQKRMVAFLTADLLAKYMMDPAEAPGTPEVTTGAEQTTVRFEGFYFTIAKGGTLITDSEVNELKQTNQQVRDEIARHAEDPDVALVGGLMTELFADDEQDAPKIGLRARATDFMGQTFTFTTSDGQLDIHLEDAEPYTIKDQRGFAKALSDAYDAVAK